jgi:DNA-binding response OmpR family regulator
MLTGRSDPADERAALAAGARAFLTKGIDLCDLAARLRQLLSTG